MASAPDLPATTEMEQTMADKRQKRAAEFIDSFRVKPGSKVRLEKDFDPSFKAGVKKKKEGVALLATGVQLLTEYQARLAAQDNFGVLVVLQALDAAGKDGTIRHVMSGVNPQGVAVHSFKQPSAEELDHDYLWRYARRLPARGEIGIFNRSHYEEVLVVRVHPEILDRQKLPHGAKTKDIWQRRYREINDWERYLTENGFRIVKLFLNLSKEEQRIRFLRQTGPAGSQLEVLNRGRHGARALGRLPEGVLGDAVAHQHGVGAVVRDTRRPEVVCQDRRRGRPRERADGAGSTIPGRHQGAARGSYRGQGGARGAGARGRTPGSVRARTRGYDGRRERRPERARGGHSGRASA